jgi:immune inhibitor A
MLSLFFPFRRVKFRMALPLLAISLLSLYCADAFAAPASPAPFTIRQPDGQQITARRQGDEWNNWVETQGGYTIAPDQDGAWQYVNGYSAPKSAPGSNQGDAVPQQPVLTNVPATEPPPAGLPMHVRPEGQRPSMKLNMAPAAKGSLASPLSAGSNTTGTRNIVFILASFDNQQGKYLQPVWAPFITDKIADYYSKASYGKVSITPAKEDDTALGNGAAVNNGVIGWVNVSPQLKAL